MVNSVTQQSMLSEHINWFLHFSNVRANNDKIFEARNNIFHFHYSE